MPFLCMTPCVGKHNKKTAAFARDCLAYCYITIPMIDSYFERLHLYRLVAQLAVLNQSLHQAEVIWLFPLNLFFLSPDIPSSVGNGRSCSEFGWGCPSPRSVREPNLRHSSSSSLLFKIVDRHFGCFSWSPRQRYVVLLCQSSLVLLF